MAAARDIAAVAAPQPMPATRRSLRLIAQCRGVRRRQHGIPGQPLRRRGRRSRGHPGADGGRPARPVASRRPQLAHASRRPSRDIDGLAPWRRPQPEGETPTRPIRAYKAILSARARQAPVRHAPAPGRRAGQEPQLRHPDHQPRLFDADPGEASADDLFAICHFSAGRSATTSSIAYRGAHPRKVRHRGRMHGDAATCRSSCRISATTRRTRELDRLVGEFIQQITASPARALLDARIKNIARRTTMKKFINAVDTC